ncbi:hypothetical protein AAFF_G00133200 [Aldrovandia affinis]|uniref:ribonuclease H n=1 Tax=Aldrovandia affinis TaxID=143900 RepID=A0AAD7RQG1_9TELE|nr:hypothetical protein AAFF_G00133200 [Aldrovandia affinis]
MRTTITQHHIEIGAVAPIQQTARRLPLAKWEEAEAKIHQMAVAGIIQPSDIPWVSPAMLVRKKEGFLRFCVDYRLLNNVTRKDLYPLPHIDDALDSVSGSTWFSALDLRSGYWYVPLSPSARPKTAFTLGRRLWEFNVMPFGLCSSPATFKRLMEKILQPVPASACVVYLDDI